MTPPPVPPSAPRRRRPGRRLLVILAVVVVVCCGGTLATSYALVRGFGSGAGPAQAAADRFLTDLEKDDTAAAYALVCPSITAKLNRQQFTDGVHSVPRLRGHKIVAASVSTVDGVPTAEVTTDLTRDGGGHERKVLPVVKTAGTWRVCQWPPY